MIDLCGLTEVWYSPLDIICVRTKALSLPSRCYGGGHNNQKLEHLKTLLPKNPYHCLEVFPTISYWRQDEDYFHLCLHKQTFPLHRTSWRPPTMSSCVRLQSKYGVANLNLISRRLIFPHFRIIVSKGGRGG